ncbi:MAG: glutathione S-transferase family protein [Proteobacteria bacterium]|nr:glutathione S-transferase family protein [Pseudomonadota bacterium]
MADLQIVSNELCPYTQRAAIALIERGIPFERIYIDLAKKPDWFLALSPLGKVPMLKTGPGAIFETVAICEYINELAARPLHPSDPLERARHRGWSEFASAMIADIYAFYTAPDEPSFLRVAGNLRSKVAWLERHLGNGPYFSGAEFLLVDAAFAPIFRLFETFDRIGDFGIFENSPRVIDYRAGLQARASVKDAVLPDYAEIFVRYLMRQNSYMAELATETFATDQAVSAMA